MRRGKIATKKIVKAINRNVTFSKRRKCIIKKCIELSKMCELNVLMVIHDPLKERAVQY